VPHDAAWLVAAAGGDSAFVARLDSLFTMELPAAAIAGTEDIARVGVMGNYVHGNEPSHHVPYLYAWAGAPWKTQERVRAIRDRMYGPGPGGLSALGFYPVCPGSGEYVIGAPGLRRADVKLGRGRTLRVRAPDLDERNVYVQRVTLNGKPWDKTYLRHADLAGGAEIVFEMGPEPNRTWGASSSARPYSLSGEGR